MVQGSVDPDKYQVFKPLLAEQQFVPIIEKARGSKALKMVYSQSSDVRTQTVDTSREEREAFVLSDTEIILLARWAALVEQHYGCPMDMEWAKDGLTGEIYMVQARPETVQARKSSTRFTVHRLLQEGKVILTGAAVGDSIACGEVCVIRNAADVGIFRDGALLVTEMTDPDWVPVMKRAAGIITDHGGPTSHAAIVSRELGVPAIVGTGNATSVLNENQTVTLSCAEGDQDASTTASWHTILSTSTWGICRKRGLP